MNKRIKTLFFSPTNGTKKLITTIAVAISPEFEQFDITLPEARAEALHFSENDLVIIGLPTYAGRIPKLLLPYLSSITCSNALCVCVTTYGNRDYEDALLEQCDLFQSKGFHLLGAASFVTEHSATSRLATNRPDADDLATALEFGRQIKARMEELSDLSAVTSLSLPGNRPYVEKNLQMPPMAPETNDTCTKCGLCAAHCPTASIDALDCKTINLSTCIKCNSCVKRCPKKAKAIHHPGYLGMQTMLIQNFSSTSKKPELFLA